MDNHLVGLSPAIFNGVAIRGTGTQEVQFNEQRCFFQPLANLRRLGIADAIRNHVDLCAALISDQLIEKKERSVCFEALGEPACHFALSPIHTAPIAFLLLITGTSRTTVPILVTAQLLWAAPTCRNTAVS